MPPTINDTEKRFVDIEVAMQSIQHELARVEKLHNRAEQRARSLSQTQHRLDNIILSLKRQRDDLATEVAELKYPAVVFADKDNNVGYVVCSPYRVGDQFLMIKRPGPGFKKMRYPVDNVNIGATFKVNAT